MPWKTREGDHYHDIYGCCGATIACMRTELKPCSFCTDESNIEDQFYEVSASQKHLLEQLEKDEYEFSDCLQWAVVELSNVFDDEQENIENQIHSEIENFRNILDCSDASDMRLMAPQFNEENGVEQQQLLQWDADKLPKTMEHLPIASVMSSIPLTEARHLANHAPQRHINPNNIENMRRLRQATKSGIDAVIARLGFRPLSYERCIQAIDNMHCGSQTKIDHIEQIMSDIRLRNMSDSEIEQEFANSTRRGRTGCYLYQHGLNDIYIVSDFPVENHKGTLQDAALHEALHALSTHWDAQQREYVSGFGNHPEIKRELNEGFIEWLRRYGTGVQRGATDNQWYSWAYSSNYLIAKTIADVVGEKKAAQYFLDGDYEGLLRDFNRKMAGEVTFETLCQDFSEERLRAQEYADARIRLDQAVQDDYEGGQYEYGRATVATNHLHRNSIKRLMTTISRVRVQLQSN